MTSSRDNAIQALGGVKLTRQLGRPTLKNVNKTRTEIAAIYARAKTTHSGFPLGTKFGFAAAILTTATYRRIHDKAIDNLPLVNAAQANYLPANWQFAHPARPSVYDPTIIAGTDDATCRLKEAERAKLID